MRSRDAIEMPLAATTGCPTARSALPRTAPTRPAPTTPMPSRPGRRGRRRPRDPARSDAAPSASDTRRCRRATRAASGRPACRPSAVLVPTADADASTAPGRRRRGPCGRAGSARRAGGRRRRRRGAGRAGRPGRAWSARRTTRRRAAAASGPCCRPRDCVRSCGHDDDAAHEAPAAHDERPVGDPEAGPAPRPRVEPPRPPRHGDEAAVVARAVHRRGQQAARVVGAEVRQDEPDRGERRVPVAHRAAGRSRPRGSGRRRSRRRSSRTRHQPLRRHSGPWVSAQRLDPAGRDGLPAGLEQAVPQPDAVRGDRGVEVEVAGELRPEDAGDREERRAAGTSAPAGPPLVTTIATTATTPTTRATAAPGPHHRGDQQAGRHLDDGLLGRLRRALALGPAQPGGAREQLGAQPASASSSVRNASETAEPGPAGRPRA